ncbi:MAG: LTA synthase family protein, partial [Muribaculaceae bacterium]|nr:LTA synthase family protein [Muribaculaceae bacterium]
MKKPLKPINLFGRICGKIILLALIVEFIVRIILAAITPESLGLSFGQWIGSFLFGAFNDLCFVLVALAFLVIYCVTLGEGKYRRPWGYISLVILNCILLYFCFFTTIFNEYG